MRVASLIAHFAMSGQPRLKLADFRVLRDFGEEGCGCCKEDVVSSGACR